MREELIGNFVRRILHGGVISAVLDLTGGLIAFAELVKHLGAVPPDELAKRFARAGTIDMRVDYLRRGTGEYFYRHGLGPAPGQQGRGDPDRIGVTTKTC